MKVCYVSFRVCFVIIKRFRYSAKNSFISQLPVNKELFHQPSFYLIKILSGVQLLFKQWSFHQSRNGKCPGECPRLCLNSAMTQLIWFGMRQQLLKLDFPLLTNRFPSFTYSSSVWDFGVILDSSLTFSNHISTLTCSCYFHLRRLKAIRRSITPLFFATIVHAFICSRINYCNLLLMGLPKSRLSAIQLVWNAAARLIARFPRFTHISTYISKSYIGSRLPLVLNSTIISSISKRWNHKLFTSSFIIDKLYLYTIHIQFVLHISLCGQNRWAD